MVHECDRSGPTEARWSADVSIADHVDLDGGGAQRLIVRPLLTGVEGAGELRKVVASPVVDDVVAEIEAGRGGLPGTGIRDDGRVAALCAGEQVVVQAHV